MIGNDILFRFIFSVDKNKVKFFNNFDDKYFQALRKSCFSHDFYNKNFASQGSTLAIFKKMNWKKYQNWKIKTVRILLNNKTHCYEVFLIGCSMFSSLVS